MILDGEVSSFEFAKLDRVRLYGRRRRLVLGPDGEPCERAQLTEDGTLIVRSGMTDQGYLGEDGTFYRHGELVGLDEQGQPVSKQTSTLGEPQVLQGPLDPYEVLGLAARTVYVLEGGGAGEILSAALDRGDVFRFAFNYRADWNTETACLLRNEHGTFALVGNPKVLTWSELERAASVIDADEDAAEDDLDFEMF